MDKRPVIWLAGYGNANSHETLRQRALESNLLVVDVRMSAYSRREGWNGADLREHLSHRHYAHWPWWGNPTHKQGRITIADFERGRAMLENLIKRNIEISTPYTGIVLLCGCRAVSECHRGELGKRLKVLGYSVREFVWRPAR